MTYMRAQRLRAKAELCLPIEQELSKQVIGNKSFTGEFFGKNIFGEFFPARETGRNSGEWRQVFESSVLRKLIRESWGSERKIWNVRVGR